MLKHSLLLLALLPFLLPASASAYPANNIIVNTTGAGICLPRMAPPIPAHTPCATRADYCGHRAV